jgi:hypothetical protein
LSPHFLVYFGCPSGILSHRIGWLIQGCSRFCSDICTIQYVSRRLRTRAEDLHKRVLIDRFLVQQRLYQMIPLLTLFGHQATDGLKAFLQPALDLLIDARSDGLPIVPPPSQLVAQEGLSLVGLKSDRPPARTFPSAAPEIPNLRLDQALSTLVGNVQDQRFGCQSGTRQ